MSTLRLIASLGVLSGALGFAIGFIGCDAPAQPQQSSRPQTVATVYYVGTTQSSNAYFKEEVTDISRGYQGIYISFKKQDGKWVTTDHYTIHWHGEVPRGW
jgi:hypothetical protein